MPVSFVFINSRENICIFKSIAYRGQKMDQTQTNLVKNKLKTRRSKLKRRENPFPLCVREIKEATALPVLMLVDSSGRSTPWRLRRGGAPPRLALLCALVRCGCGRGGGGRRGRGGADPVGRADGTVLDGLILGAAGDGHLLAALVFVGDCVGKHEEKKMIVL